MPTNLINRQWLLAARPSGAAKMSDFEWREQPLDPLGAGEVRVRNVYLSLDPTNRVWMNEAASYLPAIPLGSVMRGGGIGVVEESHDPAFAPGDLVQGMIGWQSYLTSKGAGLTKLPSGLPVPSTAFLGLLGHIGLTAYFGLLDVAKAKQGDTLVVSTAAGAVGSLVVQIGKIIGCRVVGITGSDDKCQWLLNELGIDAAINYKTENVWNALKQHCPKGIDVYFDNVGGDILNAVLGQINQRARIALCGMISMYNASGSVPGPSNIVNLVMQRGRMEGFIVIDYLPRAQEAFAAMIPWYLEGKLKYRVDIVDGLENAPSALNRLFDGTNMGKLAVKISEEK